MIIPDCRKIGIYFITLMMIVFGLVGVCDTPNDKYLLEGIWLFILMLGITIQILFLCSQFSDNKSEDQG